MKRILLALALIGPTAVPVSAQESLDPQPGPGAVTCGEFSVMDSVAQLEALSAIEPFGDDMEAADSSASEQWASDVSAACAGHADLPLVDAARAAMGD
jgi:hypothetical protein